MTFDEALAADTLGLLLPDELPQLATEALLGGLESDALAALAGESPRAATPDELHTIFEKSLRELGIARPSQIDAASQLIRYYARQVVDGELAPERGAQAVALVLEKLPTAANPASALGLGKLAWLHMEYDALHEGFGTAEELDRFAIESFRRFLSPPAA